MWGRTGIRKPTYTSIEYKYRENTYVVCPCTLQAQVAAKDPWGFITTVRTHYEFGWSLVILLIEVSTAPSSSATWDETSPAPSWRHFLKVDRFAFPFHNSGSKIIIQSEQCNKIKCCKLHKMKLHYRIVGHTHIQVLYSQARPDSGMWQLIHKEGVTRCRDDHSLYLILLLQCLHPNTAIHTNTSTSKPTAPTTPPTIGPTGCGAAVTGRSMGSFST